MAERATWRVRRFWGWASVVGLGLLLLFGSVRPAHALFAVGIELDGVISPDPITDPPDIQIFDNLAGDLHPTTGFITAILPLAAAPFTGSVTLAVSKPVIGPQRVDLSAVVIGGPGTILLIASDTDFSLPAGPYNIVSEWGGTTDGTVDAVQGVDLLNDLYGLYFFDSFVTAIFQGPFGPGAFADTAGASFTTDGSDFSITDGVTITHTDSGQISSFNIISTVAPEPASLLLLGTGLVGLALIARRRAS